MAITAKITPIPWGVTRIGFLSELAGREGLSRRKKHGIHLGTDSTMYYLLPSLSGPVVLEKLCTNARIHDSACASQRRIPTSPCRIRSRHGAALMQVRLSGNASH